MSKASVTILLVIIGFLVVFAQQQSDHSSFTESLMQDQCDFTTTGSNQYFILEPGYREILEGMEGKDTGRLVITVLDETKTIGKVGTRVVEERELLNGKIIEISRNFYAFCKQTGSVYYFGEEVDIYNKEGEIKSHDGSWVAEGNNKAGVIMPGLPLLGARYYQEIAPGIAMDRAEIMSLSETVQTPTGTFTHCLKSKEGTALDSHEKEFKLYAPGIGLLKEENLLLVEYGFIK